VGELNLVRLVDAACVNLEVLQSILLCLLSIEANLLVARHLLVSRHLLVAKHLLVTRLMLAVAFGKDRESHFLCIFPQVCESIAYWGIASLLKLVIVRQPSSPYFRRRIGLCGSVDLWRARGRNETREARRGSVLGRGCDGRAVRCRGRRKRREVDSRVALGVLVTEQRSQKRKLRRTRWFVFLVWRRHRIWPQAG
jgi:hypothetical protein